MGKKEGTIREKGENVARHIWETITKTRMKKNFFCRKLLGSFSRERKVAKGGDGNGKEFQVLSIWFYILNQKMSETMDM